jgi:hypothetical protein
MEGILPVQQRVEVGGTSSPTQGPEPGVESDLRVSYTPYSVSILFQLCTEKGGE